MLTKKMMKMVTKKTLMTSFLLGIFILSTILVIPYVLAVDPTGASVTDIATSNAPADTAGQDEALAGNVSELTVTAYSTTQTWQGYFGNVSGVIQLADSSDNVMYNWSLASPEGEVYASANETISWREIQCFNFTATGAYTDESGNGGTTSLYGTNLTRLEEQYGLEWDMVDGVNETFADSKDHDLFYTSNLQFSASECLATYVYDNTGVGVNNHFEEVLLYEPTTASVVFASILDEEGPAGFDDANHDFEMLVLENGHGTDTATTTYYFFVELE